MAVLNTEVIAPADSRAAPDLADWFERGPLIAGADPQTDLCRVFIGACAVELGTAITAENHYARFAAASCFCVRPWFTAK